MNYYEHHLGDWAAATGHLTWDEDMAYTRLLRAYYHAEKPIADGQQYRLAKASTPAQRRAVDSVLAEFFTLTEGAFHQKRADEEIALYLDGEPERKAKKANEETRLKRHREERSRLFKALADAGQHAPWNTNMNELRELVKRCGSPLPATAPATPATATQTPDTRHQAPEEEKARKRATPPQRPDDVGEQTWVDWLQLRKGKRAAVTATVVDEARSEAEKAGMSLEAFFRVWCARGSQGLQADWLKPAERAQGMTFRQRDAADAIERVRQAGGGLVHAKPVPITRRNDALQEVFDATTPRLVG